MYASSPNRRDFLAYASAVGAAAVLGLPRVAAAEAPPETTSIRLVRVGLCVAPQYVAEELLRTEGFTDIQYIPDSRPRPGTMGSGRFNVAFQGVLNYAQLFSPVSPVIS